MKYNSSDRSFSFKLSTNRIVIIMSMFLMSLVAIAVDVVSYGYKENSFLYSWGTESPEGRLTTPPLQQSVIDIDGGLNHTVALLKDGSVIAWGDGALGQLDVPELPDNQKWHLIDGGWEHVYAIAMLCNPVSEVVPIGNNSAVTVSSENSGDGGTSVKLGGVGLLDDGEMAGIEVSLTGPGVLSFDWKVSSEAAWDWLSFYEVGSGATNSISGTGGDWEHISVTVSGTSNTTHVFRWEYEKDPIGEYVGEDCGWVDAINWSPFYALVVTEGSGDGSFTNGTVVAISADAAPQYHEFDHWTGDTNTVVDIFAPDTNIEMTGTGLVVVATYKPILYPLDVTHGSGSGAYSYNSTVEIGATSYAGKSFYCWTGNVDTVSNIHSATTTVQTADYPLAVVATYSVPLTVNAGSGSGWYIEGSMATVTADPDPMYMEFAGWSGDDVGLLSDPSATMTSLTMPTAPATVTATYRDSIARVTGSYGRTYTESGTSGGVSTDALAGSPSDTPAVKLGGAGVVPDNGFAAFETVVSGSGTVTFWWKVSSESNADYLKFFVDDAEIQAVSGTKMPWTQVTHRVEGAGVSHTLRWEYVKNGSIASSTDAGWVDDIVWMSDYPVPGRNPDILDVVVGSETQGVRFFGEHGIHYIVYSNATLNADGWVPMEIEAVAFSELNGVPVFQSLAVRDPAADSCFYRVGLSAYTVTFVNWDNSVLKTEEVVQGASATAPAVDPTRPSDDTYQYSFAGWDFEFDNIQNDLTVTAQYEATLLGPPPGMVLIPGGTNSGTDSDFGAYSLTVETFYMDATEVTKAKWDEVRTWATAHGYSFDKVGSGKGANHPVHTVNWYDCVKWCNARSEKEGRTPVYTVSGSTYKTGQSSPDCNFSANGYRLPTNTEWEYAARGGLSGRRFPWGDTITHSQANYYSYSSSYSYDVSPTREYHPTYATGGYPYTSPVGAFAANGYGLYDMAGNVWEWCNDASGSARSFRGGSWADDASPLRCGYVDWRDPYIADDDHGFRCVCR